jgi:hypothetical protein
MMAAIAAHTGKIPEQIRGPLIQAILLPGIGTAYSPVMLGLGAYIYPPLLIGHACIPGRKRSQFMFFLFFPPQPSFAQNRLGSPGYSAEKGVDLTMDFLGKLGDLSLMPL